MCNMLYLWGAAVAVALGKDEFDEDADVGDAPTIFLRQTTA